MKTMTIVSNDAGGAEIISNWVKNNLEKYNYKFVISGPAKLIFKKVLGIKKCNNFYKSIYKADYVLCGTSWQSELEIDAILLAKIMFKKTIVFLDHWCHYKKRLKKNNIDIKPDQIWVGDEYARELALNVFKDIPILLKQNFYLKNEVRLIHQNKRMDESNLLRILFIGENISDHSQKWYGSKKYWGFDEFDCLDFFLKNIKKISENKCELTIRAHPSESFIKYKNYLMNRSYLFKDIKINFSQNESLSLDICNSDIVVGCESMAMVVALHANKKVYSCKPPFVDRCLLPHKGIIHLRDINDL